MRNTYTMFVEEWQRLLQDLEITDEYGTFLNDDGSVRGNMDLFSRDVRTGRIVLFSPVNFFCRINTQTK